MVYNNQSMAKNYWKKLNTKILFTHPRLTVVEDEVILPQGKQTKYLRFENLADYVTVIAESNGQIAMLREYSYPNDEWLWQFPEGSIESGETTSACARRELLEEAGLEAGDMIDIGCNYGNHRRSIQTNFVLTTSSPKEVGKSGGDETEVGTTMKWIFVDEVKAMIMSGKIVQKNALAALALYLVYAGRIKLI